MSPHEQQPTCPASDIPCSHQCWLRPACRENPARVMALVERLDTEIAQAIGRIARNQ